MRMLSELGKQPSRKSIVQRQKSLHFLFGWGLPELPTTHPQPWMEVDASVKDTILVPWWKETALALFPRRVSWCQVDDRNPFFVRDLIQQAGLRADGLLKKNTSAKCVLRPALATQNGHNSNNERGALVKLHLRKNQNHYPHLVRACTVEMHMDISEGNFCTRIYSEKTGVQMEPRLFTP